MLASAQSVQPSNATLPTSESGSETVLSLTGGPIFTGQTYNIAPLTAEVGKGQTPTAVANVKISGTFKQADYSSTGGVDGSDIAFISCDPNGSNIDPSTVVGTVGDQKPGAIVLYSLGAEECTLNGSYSFTSIFTMISSKDSNTLMTTVGLYPSQTSILTANISVNSTTTSQSSSSSSSANEGGPAPTTAVAMSILYSITGIITLLFLVIIATGAVRAHRHPERYGPRTGFPGRPRQSRAKGLARAMLETLPIVKFGDPEPVKPGTNDIEMGGDQTTTTTTTHTAPEVVATSGNTERAKSPTTVATAVESGMGPAQAESVKSGEENAAPKEGELGCSICTEDFTTGEDVRVLPCNHKYHPACIDPWLLNVSGTCPLCRHDLRPATSATAENETETAGDNAEGAEGGELPPPLAIDGETTTAENESTHQRSRASRLLDPNRLRHAPADERIAALRRLREQSQTEGEGEHADSEEPSRRARLTGRLRDAFRIKTRTQDTPQ
ncbi:uncharacterized protein LY89DRAFT_599683 [Mollisia scopiformis]|uniref:RING-type domain-containing protein n=1 Tax=Mollisia scopiformis TaxID=149040 RepID=A0A132B7S2_MOLSC|nr:uncharacterized protein LY89DRAFT_599683 [Mollisia scopiformis]KUJ08445.1 hypothetical protein LY89DRAFT_599683 [Mollisia scopiformis]